jgi:ABC-type phosphate/phosphonate transport system substrate-binding protein
MPDLRLTYYPDITQHRTPQEVRDAVVGFAATLEAELRTRAGTAHNVVVLGVVSVPEQTAMMADGRCQIGLIKPSSYVYAHRRNQDVVPAAVALRTIDGKVGDTYFAQLYTHTRSGICNMEDLKRRCLGAREKRPSIGFGDSFSTGNFLVPAAILLAHGLHPLTRFRRMEFLGGHDGVAQAVFRGEVDIGAGHDGVIVDLARQSGFAGADKQMIQLARRDIHSDPVATGVSPELRHLLTDSLLAIGARDEVKKQLDIFWGAVRGLGPTDHKNYASIEAAINSLGISEADILGV